MSALFLVGAWCAMISAIVLGGIEIARARKFHKKPNFIPALAFIAAAEILMIGDLTL